MITGWWRNNHLEKYEFVNGKDDIPYMKWKIKAMFQTTNQIISHCITTPMQWYTVSNPTFEYCWWILWIRIVLPTENGDLLVHNETSTALVETWLVNGCKFGGVSIAILIVVCWIANEAKPRFLLYHYIYEYLLVIFIDNYHRSANNVCEVGPPLGRSKEKSAMRNSFPSAVTCS